MPTHSVSGQNPEVEAAEGEAAQAQKRKQGGKRPTVKSTRVENSVVLWKFNKFC